MYKHSPNRNQRSKGIKVKHVLQICLLVAVCFWLVYQVKRSHDKRKEFDEHDAKISLEGKDEIVKLGRKDLHPRLEETTIKDEKHEEVEVEEEENTGEEEEENKHEDEEQEDNKTEEKDDDEGRGDVDEENDREENLIDDEKEREISDEQENEEKDTEDDDNKQTENDSAFQDQDREGGARNTHEAREENYKADDASSAVTHNSQITTVDNETGILEKSTQEVNASQNTLVKVENGKTVNNSSYLAVLNNEASENTSSKLNVTKWSDDQAETSNNSTEVRRETRDETTTEDQNIIKGDKTEDPNLQIIDPIPENNSTLSNQNNQHDSNSTILKGSKDTGSNHGELLKLPGDAESSISEEKSNSLAKAEDNEDNEANEDVKDDETGEINERSDGSDVEILDEVPHDPTDSSDSSDFLEEKDVRTDLETLPEIQTEGSNSEDAAE